MQDWLQALRLDTSATEKDRGCDVWDNDNCCNYSADGTKLLDAENYPSEVHVKDGTKVICDGVFAFQPYMAEDRKIGEDIPEEERASFLDKIFLPPTVTHIGREAFRECGWLKSIRLPKDLIFIGDGAFFGCWELRSVSCPAGLVAIGDGAFEECFSLNKVKFNKGLKAIGAGAFLACESLEEIVLPAGLEFIGDDAFYGASLKKIFVPKSARGHLTELLSENLHRKIRDIR